ncbi:hypothetical protein BGZ72_003969 [Mortierella alpina]|nr:hypothetical protein BGZ72_003969 [Mortierella alpina]
MSTATELDPGPVEAAKDRSSIKLMNLPLQKKKQKTDPSVGENTNTKDTLTLSPQDTVASKKTSPPASTSASAPASSSKSNSSSSGSSSTHSSSSSGSSSANSSSKERTDSSLVSLSSSIPTSRSKSDPSSSTDSSIESDSDPSFLPSEDIDQDQQPKNQDELPLDRESQPDYRVGNPPHYETREERQIRIRKQFHQLGKKKTDFLDANALVGFFAEVTPDKNVQRRYADELLQLCHSRKLHRNNLGAETLNQDGSSTSSTGYQESMEGDGSNGQSGVSSGGASYQQENGSEIRHGDEDHLLTLSKQRQGAQQVHYDDFEVFLEEKEERLWNLFREIDHNNDNEIHADELQASLAKAGINMSDAELKQFISAMDKDGDGAIDFEEWRDFLVLLPREPTLKEIYHYVQEVVAQVGIDGDVVMPPSDNDYVARYLLAGAIAGAVSRTATAPLDRLKVYLITNSMPALTGPVAQAGLKHIPGFNSSTAVAPMKQRLLWTAITDLYHQGGLKTFFRGNGLNIIKIAPESAIKFYTYETSKAFIVSHLPSLTVHPTLKQQQQQQQAASGGKGHTHVAHVPEIATSGRFLAGGIAGLVSQFSIYPLETIKTRIMSSTGRSQRSHGSSSASSSLPSSSLATAGSSSSGAHALATAESRKPCIRSVAREMWQRAGLRGFYRGLGPSLVGIFPYAAIDLSVFETLKFGYMRWKAGLHEGDAGSEEKSLERPSVFVLLACGTISGSVGATSVYPLSLVRTRLQAQGTPQHPQTYTSTLDVFRKTFEQDGIRGFYKGMVPTLTKVVPAVSISYVVYEYSKRELGL